MKDLRYPIPQDASLLPLFSALHRCSALTERQLTRFAEARGLTASQCDVLFTLGDTDGLNFKDLSEQSHVTGGTLTPVLNRMEGKGLVKRYKHPTDSRQIIVKLTPQGQALYEETFLPYIDLMRARADAILSADEQETLTQLIKRLTSGLQ